MEITKAISVRAPWWWFILHGGKDIENRDWPTYFRGTVFIHASKWWHGGEIGGDLATAVMQCGANRSPGMTLESVQSMRAAGGCIVGKVNIIDCVRSSSSPWFFGQYGFVLANPVSFAQPIPCKGALGFFTVPDEYLRSVEAAGKENE